MILLIQRDCGNHIIDRVNQGSIEAEPVAVASLKGISEALHASHEGGPVRTMAFTRQYPTADEEAEHGEGMTLLRRVYLETNLGVIEIATNWPCKLQNDRGFTLDAR